ncbi:Tumor necrosis factor ligand superfamily member 13B [Bagarius yarrelli]|uniref:Tumor necrosis factor ligand superfamily member 13B n=1 Tax=Bagarius yarrelli TaxID=175774 RepID=A0A556TXX7_BAGYA|nr:Tumor necrosis factor ligand superfamily member 13B [Bagarius yarrelli]
MHAVDAAPVQVASQRFSWVVAVVTVLAVTSSLLSAVSLYHILALQAEVEELRSEVSHRRAEGRDPPRENRRGSQPKQMKHEEDANKALVRNIVLPKMQTESSGRQQKKFSLEKRSLGSESEPPVLQPFLQMVANNKKKIFQKEFAQEKHTGIPWKAGLQRGEALEVDQDVIVVKEEGYYFIYSQVYYEDPNYAMGHIMIRMKKHVVGDESQHVVLFRCIQAMNTKVPYNTCYTGGVVKLDVGDTVELLIPRPTASISLDGECTYLGAIKLA